MTELRLPERSLACRLGTNKQVHETLAFQPLPGLSNPHVQTIAAMFWPGMRASLPVEHRLIELPDRDRIAVAISTPRAWDPRGRTVVMVHGLCGCYTSPYMVRIADRFFRRGLRTVRVNLRGCGSGAGLARYPYHSGRSEDVRRVVEWLASETPESPVSVVGFSLGGNIVLKMAGEDGDRPTGRVDSVVGVSPPIDLLACARLIEQPRNRVYDRYFVHRLCATVRELHRFFPDLPPLALPKHLTLPMFDNVYTAPRSGFRDALDYYARASSAPLIERIEIPTLLLSSRDDPFIAVPPFLQLPPRNHIELQITDHGGHLGFIGFTSQPRFYRWMDEVVVAWVMRRTALSSGRQ